MATFFFDKLIQPAYAPNSQTTLFTAPSGTAVRIDSLSVVNTDSASHTISINLVANAGSASAANLTTSAQAILPGQTWNSPNEIGKVLMGGDFISVLASAASVLSISASGLIQA